MKLGDMMNNISAADCKEQCQDDSRCTYAQFAKNSMAQKNCQLYKVVDEITSSTIPMIIVTLFEKDCSSVNSGNYMFMYLNLEYRSHCYQNLSFLVAII